MLFRGVVAGTLVGLALGLIIALFIALKASGAVLLAAFSPLVLVAWWGVLEFMARGHRQA